MNHAAHLRRSVLVAMSIFASSSLVSAAADALVFIGTYTGPKSKGIYLSRLDGKTGRLSDPTLAAETQNPTFLALHPNKRFLYAANEIGNFAGTKAGSVSAYAIDATTGQLKLLNQTSTVGGGPAHLIVDRSGKCVLVANYGGGSVAALPIHDDGTTGEHTAFIQHSGSSVNPQRQKEPHGHSINVSPDNRFAFAADLGLDKILVYALDPAHGTLTPATPPFASVAPGSGPRHFAFHPNGKYAYVINEMLSTVTTFTYDAARGALSEIQTSSTLPAGFTGNTSTAEIVVHPSGKFLYGSNRGHNSIAVFSLDDKTGRIALLENVSTQGRTPRNFNLDPSGGFLFAGNQDSDTIVGFRVDVATGRLTPTGQVLAVGSPVCLKFLEVR